MKINVEDPVTINIPRYRLVSRSRYDVQPGTAIFWIAIFCAVTILLVATFIRFPFDTKVIYRGGTNTITKTVTISAATYAQQQFIERCENSQNNQQDHGIPDTHTDNWTCSYADGPKAQ